MAVGAATAMAMLGGAGQFLGPNYLRRASQEDGISTGSLSEAKEKTIKAVYEQIKGARFFWGGDIREDNHLYALEMERD
ncbi:hypothetical protein L1887_12871 [Cichorium endivia]|nr:hypothetical protein L1887_12871 [Cichorium endivia]